MQEAKVLKNNKLPKISNILTNNASMIYYKC
jgi:hypothetical protein